MSQNLRKTPRISVKIYFWSRISTELGKNSKNWLIKFTAFCISGSRVTTRLHLRIIRFHSLFSEMHSHLIWCIRKISKYYFQPQIKISNVYWSWAHKVFKFIYHDWIWNLIKICVRTCFFGKQNSTLGSVVPLAMFSKRAVSPRAKMGW